MGAEPEVADFNEVAGPDASCLLVEEGGPALTVGRRATCLTQVPLDSSLGDGDAELEELSADALGAPQAEMWSSTFPDLCEAAGYVKRAQRRP